jgi:hypothetical protein
VSVPFETNGQVGDEVTDIDRIHLVSKGSAPNLLVGFLMHITVNANGTMTASIDKAIFSCNG